MKHINHAHQTPSFVERHLYEIVVVVFSVLLYLNAIPNGYNMDDELVTKNHKFTSRGLAAIPEILKSPYYSDDMGYAYDYRPITHISFALEHEFLGEHPEVSHSINVFLYAVLCLLLYATLTKLQPMSNALAWVITLLFAAHPLHTEIVSSIKNRDEILSLLFALAALYSAILYAKDNSWRWLVLLPVLFGFSLASKFSSIVFVLITPITLFIFYNISWKRMLVINCLIAIPAMVLNQQYVGWQLVVFSLLLFIAPFSIYTYLLPARKMLSAFYNSLIIAKDTAIAALHLAHLGLKKRVLFFSEILKSLAKYLRQLFAIPLFDEVDGWSQPWITNRFLTRRILVFVVISVLTLFFSLWTNQLVWMFIGILFLGLVSINGEDKYERFVAMSLLILDAIVFEYMGTAHVAPVYSPMNQVTILLTLFLLHCRHSLILQQVYAILALVWVVVIRVYYNSEFGSVVLPLFLLIHHFYTKATRYLGIPVFVIGLITLFGVVSDYFHSQDFWLLLTGFFDGFNLLFIALWLFSWLKLNNVLRGVIVVLVSKLFIVIFLLSGFPANSHVPTTPTLTDPLVVSTAPLNNSQKMNTASKQSGAVHLNAYKVKSNQTSGIFDMKFDRPIDFVEYPIKNSDSQSLRLGTSMMVLWHYMKKMVLPMRLSFYYGYKCIVPTELTNPLTLAIAFFHGLLFMASLWLLRRAPILSWSILVCLIGVAGVSGYLQPIAGIVADRYSIVPSIGFCVFVGMAFFYVFKVSEINTLQVALPSSLKGLLALLLVLYSGMTILRNSKWKDPITLMRNDIVYVEESAQAHNLLGIQLINKAFATNDIVQQSELRNEALLHFKKSLSIYPYFFNVAYDIGRTYMLLNVPDSAIVSFHRALEIDTTFSDVYLNLGELYFKKGELQEAIPCFEKMILINPNDYTGYDKLSYAYYLRKEFQQSIGVNQRAIKSIPNVLDPYINIARVYIQMAQMDSAQVYLGKALTYQPDNELAIQLMNTAGKTNTP
ncbi:MAG: tetratricopeptide repeat protein [Bacteroidetes bacterium]|nr:tetratricopeptide repeat protein [Bacteroidota bacterium]